MFLILQTELKVKENLHMANLLIFRNPKWGMSLIEITDDNQALVMLDSMVRGNLLIKLTTYRLSIRLLVQMSIF